MTDLIRNKVMIVDDDEIVRTVIGSVLEARGYEVVLRAQAIGTGAAILSERPEVVVLDIEMPGLRGDALFRVLKSKMEMPKVIFHSSLPRDKLEQVARESGAAGAICKADARAFLTSFEALLGERR